MPRGRWGRRSRPRRSGPGGSRGPPRPSRGDTRQGAGPPRCRRPGRWSCRRCRRWPSAIRCSTAPRAAARLSMSTLGTGDPSRLPWRTIGKPSRASVSSSGVVDPRAGNDQPVGVRDRTDRLVGATARRQRLDEDAVVVAAGGGRRPRSVSGSSASAATCSADWRRTRPTVRLVPAASWRAGALTWYPRSAAAARTFCRVSALIRSSSRLLRTNETVVRDTPARRATSSLVGRRRRTAAGPSSAVGGPGMSRRGLTWGPPSGTVTRVTNAR